jgi:hypothetical protein
VLLVRNAAFHSSALQSARSASSTRPAILLTRTRRNSQRS